MCIEGAPMYQRGLTLIEVVVAMVVIGVSLVGVLAVLDRVAQSSADPVIHKQMLSIAEALIEEVQAQPFTHCDPSDTNAAVATSASLGAATPCATLVQSFGQRNSQSRPPYGAFSMNNVAQYCAIPTTAGSTTCSTLSLPSPIADVASSFSAPTGYSATITLTPENLGPTGLVITSTAPASADDAVAMNALRISVTVNYKNESVTLEGYRTRYAPNYFP